MYVELDKYDTQIGSALSPHVNRTEEYEGIRRCLPLRRLHLAQVTTRITIQRVDCPV